MCGHEIVEAAHAGQARIGAAADPTHGQADDGTAYDGQIQHRVAVVHSAAILSGNDIEAEVQPRFDAPVTAIGAQHLLGIHLVGGSGSYQVFGFDFLGRFVGAINAASQPSGLLGKGEINPRGRGVKSN